MIAINEFGETQGKDMTFTTEAAPLPGIAETEVSKITPTGATFSAMASPNRWDASWLFEWGETSSYEHLTEFEEVIAGSSFSEYHPVSATIGGLKPATLYHYRAVVFNFTGVTNGPDQTFITPDAPKAETASAAAVGETTAHLSTRVNANSSATEVHFEYGMSAGYGTATAQTSIVSGTLAQESSVDLTGLKPGTTYHFRVVGVNEFGTGTSSDQTFTTQRAPTRPPEEVTPSPKKCPKGKVRRHGKCLRKHKSPKHHHRNGRQHG